MHAAIFKYSRMWSLLDLMLLAWLQLRFTSSTGLGVMGRSLRRPRAVRNSMHTREDRFELLRRTTVFLTTSVAAISC